MLDGQRYTFTERTDNLGRSSIMPYLPLTLTNEGRCVEVRSIAFTTIDSKIITSIYLNSYWVNNVTPHQLRIARLNRSRQYRSK
jgi:hypothetical protein